MEKNYKEGILNAIKILDDEVQRLRAERDSSENEGLRERCTSNILSHVLSIMHLRDQINDEKESE
jgi:hypothetical protein